MDQEIEVKFIVAHDDIEVLRRHLHTLSAEHFPPTQLLNIYYETADKWLRRHDMGLRIRGNGEKYEMTLKTAGRVVGGLHQRPEFNIPLPKPALALEKLPAEAWPDGQLPAGLAEQVQPLFSTDFYREKWLVDTGDSRVEIALDLGEVKAGAHQEPICELELELLSGNVDDLLSLSRQLVGLGVLRQGSLSKAARGYHLAQGNPPRALKPVTFPAAADDRAVLEAALAHWQYHEELWLRGNADAKAEVLHAVNFIRDCLAASHEMAAEQIAQVAETIAAEQSAERAAFAPQTAQVRLMLTAYLVTGR